MPESVPALPQEARGRVLATRLGGHTGDTLGAAQEVALLVVG